MTGPVAKIGHHRPIPVLLLGSARSGTTWLGNLVAAHPAVAGAQHEVHWGLAESRLYQTLKYAGDLQQPTQLVRFLEVFSASDYFRLACGDKQSFYSAPPADFYELFFRMMDDLARQTGSSHWVTKLDPMLLYRPNELKRLLTALDERYPTSAFIGIERDFRSVLKSYLNMEGDRSIHALRGIRRGAAVVLESGRYISHRRGMETLLRRRRGLRLTFHQLQSDREDILMRVAEHLSLDPDLMPREDRFKPNSSHRTRSEEDASSRVLQLVAEYVLLPLFNRMPLLADALLRLRDRTRPKRPPFYFRLLQMEKMPDRLSKHLQETGQTALWEQLFGSGAALPSPPESTR